MSDNTYDHDSDYVLPHNHIPTDPIVRRNRRHSQFSNRSETAEDGPIATDPPVRPAPKKKAMPSELGLATFVYGEWQQELAPAGSIETFCVMGAAQHEARRRILHDSMIEQGQAAAVHHRRHRRQPFLAKIEEIQRSLRIWTAVRDDGFEMGYGLESDYAALLRDLDPKATPRNKTRDSGEANEFSFLHGRAVATPRYWELSKKYAQRKKIAESNLDAREFERLDRRLRDNTERLRKFIDDRIDRLNNQLADVIQALEDDDNQPDRPFAWQFETEEGRRMAKQHAEAENGVRRYMRLFDDHRRRLIRTDLRREQLRRQTGATSLYVGDIQILVPPRYSAMVPRMQLDHLEMEIQHEKRFYPVRDEEDASYVREIRERVGMEEFTAWRNEQSRADSGRTGGLNGSQRPDEIAPSDGPTA